jgi:hypothetical protein
MVYQENASDPFVQKLGGAVLNSLLFVVMMIVATVVLVLLFKYRCMKVRHMPLTFALSVDLQFIALHCIECVDYLRLAYWIDWNVAVHVWFVATLVCELLPITTSSSTTCR